MGNPARRFESASKCAAVFTVLMGCAVLAGWWFDIPLLRFDPPHLVRMKANAAFAFLLSGISLWLAWRDAGNRWSGRISQGLALLVALLGLLTLFEYIFGGDLGIDQLLAREAPGAVKTSSPGRIAPNAALNFLLLGTSLLILPARRCEWIVSFLALAAASVSLLALMGYAYATEALQGVARYTPIALNTALTFLILSLGVLFSLRDRGLMTILSSEGPAGEIARRLLPPIFACPFALGWIRLQGQRLGLFGTEFGVALMVTSTIVILAVVVWRSTLVLNRMDAARRQAEDALREMEKRAMEQEKLASLGQVAAGIAHEIRNPLSGLNIYLSALEMIVVDCPGLETAHREPTVAILEQMKSASGKIESVIKRAMDFTRPCTPNLSVVDVNSAVEEAFALSQILLGKKMVQVTKTLDMELPQVPVDLQMIEQVLLNLITNAAQAMERSKGAREIHISTFRDGESVVISVADSGPGVPVEIREKIFDPFFTTRSDGSGIGLSICRKIVLDHSGTLTVGTAAQGGAEFRIVLPAGKNGLPT